LLQPECGDRQSVLWAHSAIPTHIALLEGWEFESFELTERPFSAPRDDTARASCGNGAKRNFLPHIAA
jgi:hypothetical protein